MAFLHDSLNHLQNAPWADTATGLLILLLTALLGHLIARRVVLRALHLAVQRTPWQWDDAFFASGAPKHLSRIVPTLILQFGIVLVPGLSEDVQLLIRNLALSGTLLFAMLALGAGLTAAQNLPTSPRSQVPVKGYLQLLKIALYIVGSILIIAVLIGRSPLLLLSGMTALSAVLMLVFKDTILGFVASVQIGSNDMLRLGDWIEMPSAGADGDVIDISLHTVKVRNWDKTITTIPTWRLISESFKNWRGMFDSGGRRIKRSIFIDAASVRFLSDEETRQLSRFRLLDGYLQRKRDELAHWNAALGDSGRMPINQRRLTNLGTFRAYAQAYLDNHPEIHHGMTCMVRQLATQGDGIPLELYGFTANTAWIEYERIQADVFDHLFAILPEFGLGLYQKPAGSDLRSLKHSTSDTHEHPAALR